MSKSAIPSPARSPRHKPRRTLSVASPAKSDTSTKLVPVVEPYIKEKFTVSPLQRRSVLPDDSEIDAPTRRSWWKRLEGSTRDILEALDTNKMPVDLPFEEEVEVDKEQQSQHSMPENSDNESVASIVVPQRRFFNMKPQPQTNQPTKQFGEIMGTRKSLGKSNMDDDNTIYHLPKNLFNKNKSRNLPVFPSALLNGSNKTINKTVEPEVIERPARNLFGQAGMKRKKNMFTDFVMSESEEDSEIQHKVFGFKKNDNRMSSGTCKRRMPSLTPSVTTDIDPDEWNLLLPSSTMIGHNSGQLEVSKITNDDELEPKEIEDQDVTLTEENHDASVTKKRSLSRRRFSRSRKYEDESDKTITNEDIEAEEESKNRDNSKNKTNNLNISQDHDMSKLSTSSKDKTLNRETSKKETLIEKTLLPDTNNVQQNHMIDINTTDKEATVEDIINELRGENVNKEKTKQHIEPMAEHQKSTHEEELKNVNQDQDMEKIVWSDNHDNNANDDVDDSNKSYKGDNIDKKTNKEIDGDENEHDDENSNEANNSSKDNKEEQEIHEENSNEQDNESNDSINEPDVEASYDNNDAEVTENEEVVDEASEHNVTQKDVDKSEDLNEDEGEQDVSNTNVSKRAVPNNVTSNNSTNASHENVTAPVEEEIDHENDVAEETHNPSRNTAKQNRKKDVTQTKVNSPETVVQNVSNDISFRPIGRSTSFRKSKIVIDDANLRHTLRVVEENIAGSDGSRNSSTEGSVWDSHRTTRKTLRQTFGKDFTPSKSLRTLVMEKFAKREREHKNMSNINKTVAKSVLEDQRNRDQCASNTNISASDQLPHSKSPALGVSTLHVSDPRISKPKLSPNKSVPDINEAEIFDREESITNTDQVETPDDSGPEISMHASYGSGISRSAVASHRESNNMSVKKGPNTTANKSAAVKQVPARVEAHIQEQEELDYDPSVQEDSTRSIEDENEGLEQEEEPEIVESEKEQSEPEASGQEMEVESEDEIEPQESEQEIEPEESEQDIEPEESERDIEPEQSEQEIEPEQLEQDIEPEDSDQEVEVEGSQTSDPQESEEEIEADESQEESRVEQLELDPQSDQEMEESEQEDSQQEIEEDSEREDSQQEIENESEQEQNVSQESVNVTQESDAESDHDPDEPREEMESELNDQEYSLQLKTPSVSSRQTERIVFDNEMSDQEIDYELSDRASRRITNDDITEQVSEAEVEQMEYSRRSERVSIGTMRSQMMANIEKKLQETMMIRLKMREQIQNSLKEDQKNFNRFMSPIRTRPIKKAEPKKPKTKARKPAGLSFGPMPKEFVEDMKYKPPKRFQPANAPWITKRLYKYLESKLEPKYDYRARVRAEKLVQNIYDFAKLTRRHHVAPLAAVDELKREMARLNIVTTHFEFYDFFYEFMPREVRVKVNPDIVNKIPMPRNGVFSDILQARPALG